jgi:hypothetical protein
MPSAGPHHRPGGVLLCGDSCLGLLLVVVLSPLVDWCRPSPSLFIFNINLLDVGILPPKRGMNQDRSLQASLFRRSPQN